MNYKQLLEVLQRMPECYLEQQVCYTDGGEDHQTVNAVRVSYFSYRLNDDTIPPEGNFVLAFD
jgi:hypothetical protein